MAGDGFTYSGSSVLKNKDNITDDVVFENWLSERTQARSLQLYFMPPPIEFNVNYLKKIHRHIFQDAFEWAGHTRDIAFTFSDGTTAVMPTMRKVGSKVGFASGNQVQKGLEAFDKTLKERDYLKGLSREEFVENAAGMFAFLNHVHPFREGNGRTQRAFFEKLGIAAGHKLDFSVVTAERMTRASIAASERGDLEPMRHMFEDISNPQKQHVLKEFFTAMRKNDMDDINYRYVVAAREGISYNGKFVGGGPDGFAMIIDNKDIVIGKRSDLTQEQRASLKQNDSFIFSPVVAGITPDRRVNVAYLIPPRPVVPLDGVRLSEQVSITSGVKACRGEVEHLARLVYGRSNALEHELMAIGANPSEGERVKQQVEADPQSIAPLAGKDKLLGKDPARKQAEAHLAPLGRAIENYADASRQARHEIMQHHNTEQKRLSQAVELPHSDIENILNLPKEQQLETLAKSPTLQKQVVDYMHKIDNRLSAAEHKAINQGDMSQLAKHLNVSQTQAKTVADTVKKLQAVHARLPATRALSQNQGLTKTSTSRSR